MFCFVDAAGKVTGATLEEIDPQQIEFAEDSSEWLTFIRKPTTFCHVDDARNVLGVSRKRATPVQMQIQQADDRVVSFLDRGNRQPDPLAALYGLVIHLVEGAGSLPPERQAELDVLRDRASRRSARGRPD